MVLCISSQVSVMLLFYSWFDSSIPLIFSLPFPSLSFLCFILSLSSPFGVVVVVFSFCFFASILSLAVSFASFMALTA